MYTDKVAAPGFYCFSGGFFVPDVVSGPWASAAALFHRKFYCVKQSIPVQLAADAELATDEDGDASTFDTFHVTVAYQDAVLGCCSRVESHRLIARELEALGVENAEAALAARAEEEGGASEEED